MAQGIVLHGQAREEFLDAHGYYTEISPRLGSRFLSRFEATLAQILENPQRFPPGVLASRKAFMGDFPYHLHYLAQKNRIVVVALSHTKRRPGYWLNRIRKPSEA